VKGRALGPSLGLRMIALRDSSITNVMTTMVKVILKHS
jgi:hypothetical protein